MAKHTIVVLGVAGNEILKCLQQLDEDLSREEVFAQRGILERSK